MNIKERSKLFFVLFIGMIVTALYYLTGDATLIYGVPIAFGMTYSNAFLYRMPAGIAGDVTRKGSNAMIIEPAIFDTSFPCLLFGILVKLVAGKIRPIASGDVVASVQYGLLVRPFPTQDAFGSSLASELPGGGAVPNTLFPANVLKSGYMTVLLGNSGGYGGATAFASIAKGDAVYVRKTVSILGVVGDIEAGSAAGNEVIATNFANTYFMGPADSNGFVEIAFNI